MKKKLIAAIVVLCLAVVTFCGLWIYEKNNQSEMKQLCQYNAAQSLAEFREYKAARAEENYWEGVANFKAFLNTWLAVEGESSTDYLWCSSVYGFMVLRPEMVQGYIDELLAAMEIIGDDCTDPNGYLKINELDNLLKHG